ncbi:hypothetical protein AALA80_08660 [Oscillospiraceae bacterium 50-60]
MAKCAAAGDFFAGQGDLTTPYFVYCKENQRGTAEKDPSLGRFDIFQTWAKRADKTKRIGSQTSLFWTQKTTAKSISQEV